MEIFLIKLLQFLLSISILVLLHEAGHMFFARLFGIRVEKFYLFFDPYFHLFEFKPKNSHTTYGIGWLPLGGYCKIAGMIDESLDTEQMKREPQPWEFRTKPAWQRLLVMLGGVLVNFVLALFIYAMILFHWGESYVPMKNMTMGMEFNDEAKALGFRDGDVLLGTDLGEFNEFNTDVFRDLSQATRADVMRDGKAVSIALPGDLNLLNMIKAEPMFVTMLVPAVVDSVLPGTPAEAIGLQHGDRIIAINGREATTMSTVSNEIGRIADVMAAARTHADSLRARTATIVTMRGERADTATVTLTASLKLGFMYKPLDYEAVSVNYGFFESFPAGVAYGLNILKGYVSDMRYVVKPEGVQSLGGFGTIGSLFPSTWNWYLFWRMTAFLSIILAVMNILPIPALDGGHVLFLVYEMVTRRKPSETFLIRAQYVGFAILLLLLIVANLNDVLRWLGYM